MADTPDTPDGAGADVQRIADPEINALASAYYAIKSQRREAWARMVEWLDAKIASDLEL